MCDGLCNAPSCYCSSEIPYLNQPDYSGGGEEGATLWSRLLAHGVRKQRYRWVVQSGEADPRLVVRPSALIPLTCGTPFAPDSPMLGKNPNGLQVIQEAGKRKLQFFKLSESAD